MSLFLVGDNIDKKRSHQLAESGTLVQLMRGIYVEATVDIDHTVLTHAVRIAQYLYPKAYLAATSAITLGPTRDGRLFISGQRAQRTRIRALEIIQNKAPAHPSLAAAVVADAMGEFRVNASSIRQRFLEAFRMRSEHASSFDDASREAMALRLVEEYGSSQRASDALWALARENEWYREGESAERFMLRQPVAIPMRNEAAFELTVAWHGAPIGQLTHDGFEWRWRPIDNGELPVVRQTIPGRLPPFVVSLLPEGWLETVLRDRDERAALRSGKRYMSNITIVENSDELSRLPQDVLHTRLVQFSAGGIFTGAYAGPGRTSIEQSFERNLAQIYESAETPRLSGVQIKAPMYLDADGVLTPSIGIPFTHILKPAGTSGFEALPLVEWTALELGRRTGFAAPANALLAMPDDMPPALIVERFDIRRNTGDHRLLAMEDMCSVLDLPPEAKYDGTMERVARAVRALSTAPEEDVLLILKRALFSWLIADGDMHLKNMALLKTAQPGERTFSSVRVAPLYDAVTTRVFPKLANDRMALKLNGRDEKWRKADFIAMASTAGLKVSDAEGAMLEVITRLGEAISEVSLPAVAGLNGENANAVERTLEICRTRVENFG